MFLSNLNGQNFQLTVIGAKKNKTLISPPTLGHITSSYYYIYQSFACVFFLWISSNRDVVNIAFELNHMKFKCFKFTPSWLQLLVIFLVMILVVFIFFLVLTTTNDPFGRNLDHGFPPPFSWLQLPMIFVVVILVVFIFLSCACFC